MKSDYETRAKKFVKQFFEDIVNNMSSMSFRDFDTYTYLFNKTHKRKVIFRHGMARCAFITSDYVVKIDKSGFGAQCFGGCEDEMKVYSLAVRDGFAYMFAKIGCYVYNNQAFYIMPRVSGISNDNEDCAYYYMTEEEEDWCEQIGLSDLHNENFGIIKGHPVIFDYASFNRESYNEKVLESQW